MANLSVKLNNGEGESSTGRHIVKIGEAEHKRREQMGRYLERN